MSIVCKSHLIYMDNVCAVHVLLDCTAVVLQYYLAAALAVSIYNITRSMQRGERTIIVFVGVVSPI